MTEIMYNTNVQLQTTIVQEISEVQPDKCSEWWLQNAPLTLDDLQGTREEGHQTVGEMDKCLPVWYHGDTSVYFRWGSQKSVDGTPLSASYND